MLHIYVRLDKVASMKIMLFKLCIQPQLMEDSAGTELSSFMKGSNMKIEGNVFLSEWCYLLGSPDMHMLKESNGHFNIYD